MRARYWIAIAAVALFLHGSAVDARAGSGGSDWVWMAPLIAAGAIGVGYVIIRMVDDTHEDDAPPPTGARPPRGMLQPISKGHADAGASEPRVLWDVQRCSRGDTVALACW